MSNNDSINTLLNKKIRRQVLLNEKSKQLQDLNLSIKGSKFTRWFGTSYLTIKSIIVGLAGIGILLVSILLLAFPQIVLLDNEFRSELINESKKYYEEMAGQTLRETLYQLALSNGKVTPDQAIQYLEQAFNDVLEQEIIDSVQLIGVLFFITAIAALYILRLTLKMRRRNKRISDAQTFTQEIIRSFKETIAEEEQELIILQAMLKEQLEK